MKALRITTLAVLTTTALFALTIMCIEWQSPLCSEMLMLMFWVVSPLVFTGLATLGCAIRIPSAVAMLIGSIAMATYGVYQILEAYYIGLVPVAPYNHLVFFVVPGFQWIGGLMATTVALVLLIYSLWSGRRAGAPD